MKYILILLFSLTCIIAKPTVTVSILPQTYFVEKIAGDTLSINVMVLPGNSPATYEPKPKQMVALENSDAYFAIGVPFEKTWLSRFEKSFPNLKIINTHKGIKKLPISNHHHEDEKANELHEVLDPHIWLDPILVKKQALQIAEALKVLYPDHKELYTKNLKDFLAELDMIHKTIQTALKLKNSKKFMVFHPSWGYFAKRYQLEQEAIEIEGKEPKPSQLANIIKEAREEGIKNIIIQPQFSKKSATLIAKEIGATVISVDQLSIKWKDELLFLATMLSKN